MNKELFELATLLNDARIAANFQDMTAPEMGVYGHIRRALMETLALLLGSKQQAEECYEELLNGNSMQQAVEYRTR